MGKWEGDRRKCKVMARRGAMAAGTCASGARVKLS